MINIKGIVVDFDGVIANTVKAFCETYNSYVRWLYCNSETPIRYANWKNVKQWDMLDECIYLNDELKGYIFGSELFFQRLEAFDGALSTLEFFSSVTDVMVCTVGTPENVSKKISWMQSNAPFLKMVPIITPSDKTFFGYGGKSILNMKDYIFIDDHMVNLNHSNAEVKICFGEHDKKWNQEWEGLRAKSWDEDFKNQLASFLGVFRGSRRKLHMLNDGEIVHSDTNWNEVLGKVGR